VTTAVRDARPGGVGNLDPPPEGAWQTLVRGLRLSPDFRQGLAFTLLLAALSTVGRVVTPIAVQLTIDHGLVATAAEGLGPPGAPEGMRVGAVITYTLGATVAVLAAAIAGYGMNYRLARATENALSSVRVRAFRRIHDFSLLHHATEHRGALVSRVTADVDTISQFMQWGGVVLIVNIGQLLLATAVMVVYSWQLTVVVLLTFFPLAAVLRWFQRRLIDAYHVVRERVGAMLSAIGESVVAAPVIRAYAIEDRTDRRVTEAVERQASATYRAGKLAAFMFTSGEVFAAVASAAAVVVGVLLGVGGQLSPGRLIAFLFLVTLFVGPVQVATEVLDEAQTAIAGWRRVLNVLDTPADVADPSTRPDGGVDIPPGPITVRFEHVTFRYPPTTPGGPGGSGPPTTPGGPGGSGPKPWEGPKRAEPAVLDVDVVIPTQTRVAVVGETGSGKTTFAKLLTRLMDPLEGRILVNGVALTDARFSSLRRRIVMVPQDGYLFDTTIAENVRHGRPGLSEDDITLAFTELGLAGWLDSLAAGLHTHVGQRGESLSVGERQFVALARAYVANPDLLVLDEATSAVDPATEVRLQRALEGLTRGRTALTIAHRLSTAEAADEVFVFKDGRIVQRGTHADLVAQPGEYARLHASWGSREWRLS
jgi:ATP-binding cassette, subfamily B, bacterial